jgi:hypothetical protein
LIEGEYEVLGLEGAAQPAIRRCWRLCRTGGGHQSEELVLEEDPLTQVFQTGANIKDEVREMRIVLVRYRSKYIYLSHIDF